MVQNACKIVMSFIAKYDAEIKEHNMIADFTKMAKTDSRYLDYKHSIDTYNSLQRFDKSCQNITSQDIQAVTDALQIWEKEMKTYAPKYAHWYGMIYVNKVAKNINLLT